MKPCTSASLKGLRVLVVEDETLVSMLIEDYLDEIGCEVVGTACTVVDAMEKARSVAADVGLLDLNLAGVLSYPVAAVLRERGLKVVFATGYGTIGLPPPLAGLPIMAKPFNRQQLADVLCRVVNPSADRSVRREA